MLHIEKINAQNFKNYASLSLDFDLKLNGFTGVNGSGKTNLLDAIHYLCLTRSFFGHTDSEIIQHNQGFYTLEGQFKTAENAYQVLCKFGQGRKKAFSLDAEVYSRLAHHIGLLPVIMIAPDDIKLIKGLSEDRRKLMDQHLSQVDSEYLEQLIIYNKNLKQRNAALKRMAETRQFDEALIQSYDNFIIPSGQFIHERRKALSLELATSFQKIYQSISGGRENVSCDYKSELLDNSFESLIQSSREKDRIMGRTTKGPHRDDLIFRIEEKAARKFGSQGQQKSYLLSIKLALYELLQNAKGIKPILLLDDIFDKLDEHRVKNLIETIMANSFGQIFITDTDTDRLQEIFNRFTSAYKIYQIEAGEAKALI